jgi:hypothetical protein
MPSYLVVRYALLVSTLKWLCKMHRYAECWFDKKGWHVYVITKWFDCTATLSQRIEGAAVHLDPAAYLETAARPIEPHLSCGHRFSIDLKQIRAALKKMPECGTAAVEALSSATAAATAAAPPGDAPKVKKPKGAPKAKPDAATLRLRAEKAAIKRLTNSKERTITWTFDADTHRLEQNIGGSESLYYITLYQDHFDYTALPSTTLLELVVAVESMHAALNIKPDKSEPADAHRLYKLAKKLAKAKIFNPNRPDLEWSFYRETLKDHGTEKPLVKRQTTIGELWRRQQAPDAGEPIAPTRKFLAVFTVNGVVVARGAFTDNEQHSPTPAHVGEGELRVIKQAMPDEYDQLELQYGHHTAYQVFKAADLCNAANLSWRRFEGIDDVLLRVTLLCKGTEFAVCHVAQGASDVDLVVAQ